MKNLALLTLLALAALSSAAPTTYRVTQSVGTLALGDPNVADPYLFLDFQLTDGAGVGNGNSSVAIANLALSGGTIDYGDRRLGDLGSVTGTGASFTLGGDAPLSDRAVLFRVTSASAVLTYDFTLTSTGIDAPTPDGFNVALLYRTGAGTNDFNVVQTLGATGNEMVATPSTAARGRSLRPTVSIPCSPPDGRRSGIYASAVWAFRSSPSRCPNPPPSPRSPSASPVSRGGVGGAECLRDYGFSTVSLGARARVSEAGFSPIPLRPLDALALFRLSGKVAHADGARPSERRRKFIALG